MRKEVIVFLDALDDAKHRDLTDRLFPENLEHLGGFDRLVDAVSLYRNLFGA